MEMDAAGLRAEHDAVLERVSSRRSIECFAHGAIAGGVGGLVMAAAAKLWWDFSEYLPEYYVGALVVAVGALGYSAWQLRTGFVTYRREKSEVARLLELRRKLDLDLPGAMFPR
jgi:hypothetical protein